MDNNQYNHYSQCKRCGTPIKHIYEFAGSHYGSECIGKVLGYDITRDAQHYRTRNVDEIIKLKKISDEETKARIEERYQEQKAECEHLFLSKDVGNVGDKIEVDVTINTIFGFKGTFGYSTCVKYSDKEGNLFISFSTAKFLDKVEKGDKITLSGAVKRHKSIIINNYDSREIYPDGWVLDRMGLGDKIKETQLTRIKLVK